MKPCCGCGEAKPLGDYHRDQKTRDGRKTRCKVCLLAHKKAYYEANREKSIAYARRYREEHPGRGAETARRGREDDPQRSRDHQIRYRKRHPERVRRSIAEYRAAHRPRVNAREAVNHAVTTGSLVPPPECERCGHDFSVYRREAHHDDYARRLDVEWLCALCHKRHHVAVA